MAQTSSSCWPSKARGPLAAPTLSDLPEDVLIVILSRLRAADLACVAAQDRRLRAITSSSRELWRPLVLSRWPLADADAGAEHYAAAAASPASSAAASPWCRLYCGRASAARLAPAAASLGTEADRCRMLLARLRQHEQAGRGSGGSSSGWRRVGGTPSSAETCLGVMECVFALGVARAALLAQQPHRPAGQGLPPPPPSSSSAPSPSASPLAAVAPDYGAVEASLALWLGARPDAAVSYARATAAMIRGGGGRGGGGAAPSSAFPSGLAAALQRRSSLQFLIEWLPRLMSRSASRHAADAAAAGPPLCPSIAARLQAEAGAIDGKLRAALGGGFAVTAPAGVPRSHAWWWWASAPAPSSSSCAPAPLLLAPATLLPAAGGRR